MKTTSKAARFWVPRAGWQIDYLATTQLRVDDEEYIAVPDKGTVMCDSPFLRKGSLVEISTRSVTLRGRVKKVSSKDKSRGDGATVTLGDVAFDGPWRSWPKFPTAIGEIEVLEDPNERVVASGYSGTQAGYRKMRARERPIEMTERVLDKTQAFHAILTLCDIPVPPSEPVSGLDSEQVRSFLSGINDCELTMRATAFSFGLVAHVGGNFYPDRFPELESVCKVLQHLYEGFSGKPWYKRDRSRGKPSEINNPLKGLRGKGYNPKYLKYPSEKRKDNKLICVVVNDRREGMKIHWIEIDL